MFSCDSKGWSYARWQMKEECQQVEGNGCSVCGDGEAAFAVLCPLLAPPVQGKD